MLSCSTRTLLASVLIRLFADVYITEKLISDLYVRLWTEYNSLWLEIRSRISAAVQSCFSWPSKISDRTKNLHRDGWHILALLSALFSLDQKLVFFLNNLPEALIIQIYSVIKLYMFRASSLPIIRSTKQRQDGTAVPSWLCLETVIKNQHESYQCRMYGRVLLMMGREDARNM